MLGVEILLYITTANEIISDQLKPSRPRSYYQNLSIYSMGSLTSVKNGAFYVAVVTYF